jgi:hypothetical protein
MPFTNGSVILALMNETGFEKNCLIPLPKPSHKYGPISSILLDECPLIPNAEAIPVKNGSKMLL